MIPLFKKILFASILLLSAANLPAQADAGKLKINVLYTQQEKGMVGLDLLAVPLGRLGQLGLNFASASYQEREGEDDWKNLSVNQYALAWRTEEPLLNLEPGGSMRTLDFVATFRVGTMIHEQFEVQKIKNSQFNFMEMDALFMITSRSQGWMKGSSIGVGSGFRFNFIDGAEFIGTSEVNRIRAFPSLQAAFSLF